MDKLTTRDMDYLFMDRDTSYLAEPFDLMKNIKPCFIDEHFGDIKKRIIIKIENPTFEDYRDRYLEFESRSVLKRLYGGSLGSFVAALNAEQPLEQREIDELRQFLDDMSR